MTDAGESAWHNLCLADIPASVVTFKNSDVPQHEFRTCLKRNRRLRRIACGERAWESVLNHEIFQRD
jgi:hypothetical protein